MAAHGYIPSLQSFLLQFKRPPRVLEIGIDRGVMLIPLVVAMASKHESFLYLGVDIKIQESLTITVNNLGSLVSQCTNLFQENSLSFLPKLVDQSMKFDLVLLDGDHNYHTVNQELQMIKSLLHDESLLVVDDYLGKWSERDMWYSERPGYENVSNATKSSKSTDYEGVKPAVDQWIEQNPDWCLSSPLHGEPVLITRRK